MPGCCTFQNWYHFQIPRNCSNLGKSKYARRSIDLLASELRDSPVQSKCGFCSKQFRSRLLKGICTQLRATDKYGPSRTGDRIILELAENIQSTCMRDRCNSLLFLWKAVDSRGSHIGRSRSTRQLHGSRMCIHVWDICVDNKTEHHSLLSRDKVYRSIGKSEDCRTSGLVLFEGFGTFRLDRHDSRMP